MAWPGAVTNFERNVYVVEMLRQAPTSAAAEAAATAAATTTAAATITTQRCLFSVVLC